MLASIIELSLRLRAVVLAVACIVVGYGIYVALHTHLDVFPEFASPQVVIQTEAPGLSAEQVEQLITRPVENGLNGTPNLESIRSQSIQGVSAVTLTFDDNADIYRVRQLVAERLTEVTSELPQGVKAPAMGALTSSTGLFLAIGLTSNERTAMDVRTFAEWTLRQRLLSVPGVSRVDVFGGERRQLQIQVKPDRLVAFSVSLDDVVRAANRATGVRGAGFVENVNQRIIVSTEGQSLSAKDLGNVVLGAGATTIADVADVVAGAEPKFGGALVMGHPGVILLCWSQFGMNTLDVTAATEAALAEMAPALAAQKIELHPRLFRPATFIERSLSNINHSLALGAVLVAAILLVFLLDLRSAFASFVSIPLSLLGAVIVLDAAGVSLNTISLGGFAIAIGVVVDDAIIDVENILRRVREYVAARHAAATSVGARSATASAGIASPAERPLTMPAAVQTAPSSDRDRRDRFFDVVLRASLEVRSAVVYATFIVGLVFVPVLTMTGVQGRLFSPLAVSFILATLASLVAALTVTPALCYVLFRRTQPHEEPRYLARLKALHRHLVEDASRHASGVMTVAVALFAVALLTIPFMGGEFLPEFREGHFIVHMVALPGTSLDESLRLGKQVTAKLLENPDIRSVSLQVGRAEGGEDTWGTHLSEFHVDLTPDGAAKGEGVAEEIRETLLSFPGLAFNVMPFLAERMEETISGATAQLVINIFGDDLDLLDRKADEVLRVIERVRGAVDVGMEAAPGLPELSVRLRPERLQQLGFEPLDVLDTIQTAYQGAVVAQTYEGNRVYDVAVVLEEKSRREPEAIGALLIRNERGLRVPLRELADIAITTGRYVIVREGAQRRQQVTANVAGRDIASFSANVKQAIAANVTFPAGTYVTYGGSAEAQRKARRELLIHSIIAGAGVVLLLAVVFRTGRNLLLVLANLPFAMIGGVLAVFLTGGNVSVGTLVGFVTLFGITMRNSIMLVSHYEHLVEREGMAWGLEAAVRGASERLTPILMTALVTGLGLLPLALGSGAPGREIEGPMAVVIIGGLLTSTVLNLVVLPTLAVRFGRFERAG